MAACRYEISLLVMKKYFTRSLCSRVKYFSTLEEKFRISARAFNILYKKNIYVSVEWVTNISQGFFSLSHLPAVHTGVCITDIVTFCSFSRLSDKAHSVAKESGNITLKPVASNNGRALFIHERFHVLKKAIIRWGDWTGYCKGTK